MKTTYKILTVIKNVTYIGEYWDDLEIRTYTVYRPYTGGNILSFIRNHNHYVNMNWENLQLYLETTSNLF